MAVRRRLAGAMACAGCVVNFFASKNVYLVTAFLCWKSDEVVQLWRDSQSAGLRLRLARAYRPAEWAALAGWGARREGALLDTECPAARLLVDQASAARAFGQRYTWLAVHAGARNASAACAALARARALPDADVTCAGRGAAHDLYRVKPGEPLRARRLPALAGRSRAELAALWARTPAPAARRRDLAGVYLSAATVISHPQYFKSWSDVSSRAVDTFPKLTYPLMMHAAEDLHFKYDLRQVDLYGEERNGSFNGLAGLLQRGRVELGVSSMFMRADRMRVLHYCSETVEIRGAFLFRQPARSAVSNVFLLPFSGGVWAAVGAAGVGAALALGALALLGRRGASPDPALLYLAPADCFTFAVGAMCQQGSALRPRACSLRLVMFSALLCSLFVFTAYSAKVVSILQAPSDALRTIDDLADSPMTLGVQDTTYKKVYFAESGDAATQRLFRRKVAPLGERAYLTEAAGIARVRAGLFAFQVEVAAGYDIISKTFTEREKCELKEIQAFKLPMVAVPIRRHSGYRDLLASRLRWQRETGLMARARRVWLAQAPRCSAGGTGFGSVGLREVLPALRALLVGAAAALLLLLAERLARPASRRPLPPWRSARTA